MSTEQVTNPFDLEAAKAGKPVCTKWGLPVRVICWDYKCYLYPSTCTMIALVDNGSSEMTFKFKEDGTNNNPEYDLRMVPEVLTQWVNVLECILPFGSYQMGHKFPCFYRTEKEAFDKMYSSHWKVITRAKRVDIEL